MIDSNPSTSAVLVMLGQQFGCRVIASRSVEDALALLRQENAVDLVAIDLAIPDMDPYVAAQLVRILDKDSALPIVAIADAETMTDALGARGACFDQAVAKPYSPRELYGAFETALIHAAQPALPLS
ncbi:response regulator [Bauldia litoralis]|uniref:response regulator n=1 Tax=Bauldia litoralis TaxID=665467 RepID=UPI00158798EE|nr:response regulator [Bauldia litoralis]